VNIKKLIKFSFSLIIFLILLIGIANSIVLYQIKDINISREKISRLVLMQEEMNDVVITATNAVDLAHLEKTKEQFISYERAFEKIKKSFTVDLMDLLFDDIEDYATISQKLQSLYKNEKAIEKVFDQIYELTKQQIQLDQLFSIHYPKEKAIRIQIESIIAKTTDITLVKIFGDLKYYSKETLYQYKNQESLDKWIGAIVLLKPHINQELLQAYHDITLQLGQDIIKMAYTDDMIDQLSHNIITIIANNKELNQNIEKQLQIIIENFTQNISNYIIAIILFTIIFILIFSFKVHKNVALSVDEIEQKVQDGLKEIKQLSYEIQNTQKEVVFTMGAIGESRSKETGNHVKRVAEYSKLLALKYGLSEEIAEMLKQASPMHDIGKVAIPDDILNKKGALDAKEREIMNTHAQLGFDMLKHSSRELLQCAAIVAYEHHEKWDGSGYPNGKAKEQIHIYGRITALADVFDALGSDRCYKKAWDDERIFALFKEEKGKHFDPSLVDLFFANLDAFLDIRSRFKDP
jgi:response regulator RpfG family c-di-GMP phosphodiesterase